MAGWVLMAVPLALMGFGVPVFAALFAGAAVVLLFFMAVPPVALYQSMFGAMESYALLAIPFFIFAGELMARGSVARRMVNLVGAVTGPVRGNVGVTTVATTTLFGALSGSAPATVATVGRLLLPALRKGGYPDTVSAGLLASAGTIGVLVPPSIPLIVYGVAANASVPRLFAAGILPGLLVAGLTAFYVFIRAQRDGIQDKAVFDFRYLARVTAEGGFAMLPAIVILGGIYGGIFSPTEAAGVAAVVAAVVVLVIYRDLDVMGVLECARDAVVLTAQVMVIVAAAGAFSWVLTVNGVPQSIAQMLSASALPPWALLIAINAALLLLGAILDPIAAILIVTPVLAPVISAAGIDIVHFGVVIVLNLAIGLMTPPLGLSLFVAQGTLGLPLATVLRGITPVLVVQLLALAIVTAMPALSLWLPAILFD
ncbi:TRAP transporter large permease [uncultured Roseobacter sp.]|uniref:TRAP transporter large permease n=1 Tax=uncultured Roseobacter sp. TaxID=114847 RepID=UPI002631EF27|nr:TRAP transporter large permease [uncultured Roseobacter sp.]